MATEHPAAPLVEQVITAARAWRAARMGPSTGGVFHQACGALSDAVAMLDGELDREPRQPPTADDLARSRELVKRLQALRDAQMSAHPTNGDTDA
jgi:hypothetical protein